jgi:hypothetical protein
VQPLRVSCYEPLPEENGGKAKFHTSLNGLLDGLCGLLDPRVCRKAKSREKREGNGHEGGRGSELAQPKSFGFYCEAQSETS